jgi:hypothetical protein
VAIVEFGLGFKLWRRVASGFGFGSWGFGSVLFDNRIGRKRDVGGGVLAGPWLSGRLFKRELRNSIRGLRPEETTDGHVSTIIALRTKHARPS